MLYDRRCTCRSQRYLCNTAPHCSCGNLACTHPHRGINLQTARTRQNTVFTASTQCDELLERHKHRCSTSRPGRCRYGRHHCTWRTLWHLCLRSPQGNIHPCMSRTTPRCIPHCTCKRLMWKCRVSMFAEKTITGPYFQVGCNENATVLKTYHGRHVCLLRYKHRYCCTVSSSCPDRPCNPCRIDPVDSTV